MKNTEPDDTVPGIGGLKTSEPFSLAFSTSENILYIINQHTNKDYSIGNFNFLHTLQIAADGKLTEETELVQIPVPSTVRPKGSLVINM